MSTDKPNSSKPPRGLTITLEELAFEQAVFDGLYPFDADCIEGLVTHSSLHLRSCYNCEHLDLERAYGSSKAKCKRCGSLNNLFKGTFYDRIRKPRGYMAALYLLDKKIGISSNRLAKFAGIAQSTAHGILKKIELVIVEALESSFHFCASKVALLDSVVFQPIHTKRSSQTVANKHPNSEEDAIRPDRSKTSSRPTASGKTNGEPSTNESNGDAPSDCTDFESRESNGNGTETSNAQTKTEFDESFNEIQKRVLDVLSEGPLTCDFLHERIGCLASELISALSYLEIMQIIKQDIYGRYSLNADGDEGTSKIEIPRAFSVLLNLFFDKIRHVYHGISRKNLQLYYIWFWCHIDKEVWGKDALFVALAKGRYVGRNDVRHFVTPPQVKVLAA